jgi:aminodeoxyfutalosine synthase
MVEQALEAAQLGVTEIHVVGGEHPDITYEWYIELVRRMHEAVPDIHLKMWTASEIRHLGRLGGGLSDTQVLQDLVDAGLSSMPGGGAEVFSQRVRDLVCRGKDTAEEWLEVHRRAHEIGVKTNCTMLYGHVETHADRVAHMRMLRDLQDETGGFLAYIPLAYHPDDNELGIQLNRRGTATTGFDDLRVLAAGRLYLDNIPHIKTHWIMVTPFLSQTSLSFGVNDMEGTVVREKIYHAVGAHTPQAMTLDDILKLIRGAKKIPAERDSFYNVIRTFPSESPEQPPAVEAA